MSAATAGAGAAAQFIGELSYLWSREQAAAPTLDDDRTAAPTWLGVVYSLVDAGETDQAIDGLFDNIDDLLLAREFSKCNALLLALDPKRLDTNLLVAALSITRSAAGHLPDRAKFVRRAEARIRELAPDRVEGLLSGLR